MNQETFNKWAKTTPKIRENILKMIHQMNSGHPGGSLSSVEILFALYAKDGVMSYNPENFFKVKARDRFVLSKGHGVPTLYAILSHIGHDISVEELMTLRRLGSRLQGHPDRARLPYVEASTGSLGQGASIAEGMAMSYKLDGIKNQIFCLIGDGEMQEGQIWEVALSAPHHKLNNLTVILDYNKGQIDGPTNKVLNIDPPEKKWEAFGWNTIVIDGHKYEEIVKALQSTHPQKPTFIVANTIKGKGVSFMEGGIGWHGKAPSNDELKIALADVAANTSIGL